MPDKTIGSPWMKLFLVRQRHAAGSNELRGCVWSKRGPDGAEKTEVNTKSRWLEVLGDVFRDQLVGYSRIERDGLWNRVRELHEV